ncbi:MAG: hypothetical protein RMM17_05660 [Acidobacteriota bacterium]|nr:PepSY domain-containing protein [Blastocatellia bacterium]MDW8412152.1 hypothetical protein [Acidobacteriota bacterium]
MLLLILCFLLIEEKINKDAVPQPIKEEFRRLFPKAKLKEAKLKTRDGVYYYELEGEENNKEVSAEFKFNFELVEYSEDISIDELPRNLHEAVTKQIKGQITEVERIYVKGKLTSYEIEYKLGDKTFELEIDTNGNILRNEED